MNIIMKRENRGWQVVFSFLLVLLLLSFTGCSEDNTEEDEYANWQKRNEEKTDQWAANANNGTYQKILTFTKDDSTPGLMNSDYIYYEVLEKGKGTESPIYTDTVRVAYRGRLIPTTNYSQGYVFDETFLGDFDWTTAYMTDFAVSSVVTGFSTAVMNMHAGDHWRVYIPYQLGYGTTSSNSIRGYSNLTFDIALKTFWHPGEKVEKFKSR